MTKNVKQFELFTSGGRCDALKVKYFFGDENEILETQTACSLYASHSTFCRNSGKTRTITRIDSTHSTRSKTRGTQLRSYKGKRAMGPQRGMGVGDKVNAKETLAKTEQNSSHLRKCGIFLRHRLLDQRKASLSWIPVPPCNAE